LVEDGNTNTKVVRGVLTFTNHVKKQTRSLAFCASRAGAKVSAENALRRLQKDELVVKLEYGQYQIQDEGFVEWLRQLELEE
jgi:hypothetical protein